MKGRLTLSLFVLLAFAVGGCQQVESRLRADAKALLTAIKPTVVQDVPEKVVTVTAPDPTQLVPPESESPQPTAVVKDCPHCPELIALPTGEVYLGSLADEVGREPDEGPVQKAQVKAVAIGKYEVTIAQWRIFVEQTGHPTSPECLTWAGNGYDKLPKLNWQEPGFMQTDNHPVVCVSWLDAKAYTLWLSQITGKTYRLPSEIEWEYAAKAGQGMVPFPWSSDESPCNRTNLADQSLAIKHPQWRLAGCSDGFEFTSPVGSFSANPWGIFDLQGNAMEWVSSCYSKAIHAQDEKTSECPKRVIKGGSWDMSDKFLRNAYRGSARERILTTGIGFRVAREGN